MHDLRDLDERYVEELFGPLGAPGREATYALLRSKGAPAKCHVLGGDELDGREMDLSEALDQTIGSAYGKGFFGTMISCVKGRLAYLDNEAGRYVLERPASVRIG